MPSKTIHTISEVFIPSSLPGVSRFKAKSLFDIALIKLGKVFLMNWFGEISYKSQDGDINDCGECWPITPIDLAPENLELEEKAKLLALGWGLTDHSGWEPRCLRQVELTLNLNETIGRTPADKYFLHTNVGPDGQDTCAGDSGITH